MADKFAIASGDFSDPAIWSDTDGGAGGASAPTKTDDIYLTRSVSIANFVTSSTPDQNIYVAKEADCSIASFVYYRLFVQNNKTLTIDGTLRMADESTDSNKRIAARDPGGKIVIGRDGRLFMKPVAGSAWEISQTYVSSTSVENFGRIIGGRILSYYAPDPCGTLRPGIVDALEIWSNSTVPEGVRTISDDFETSLFHIQNAATSAKLVIFSEKAKIGTLRYQLNDASGTLILEQHGDLEISGDVIRSSNLGVMDWRVLDDAKSSFVGTADQVINMPDGVSGQTWLVDKPVGRLDLTRFDGFLQGRVGKLIVRAASSVDLSGASPCLINSANAPALFHGLKADVCSTDQLHALSSDAVHEFEAMDSCVNYGRITIPAGKTLCCKSFDNRTGAVVLGDGILCVEYGALTNLGSISPTISIRYFNRPRSVSISVTPLSGPLPLTVFVSVESDLLHTFEWGNGHVTGPTEATSAEYTYREAGFYNVTVTASDSYGNEWSTSRPVTVLPRAPLPQARLSVTPWQGDIPLDVELSTDGSEGTEMSVDWGDGSTPYGPMNKIESTISHRYEMTGRFLVKLRVWNASGDVAEASQVISIRNPGELRADLVLSPSAGEAPLTILADASGSNGDGFLFTWGDGTSDGPQSEPLATHTFDRAGYYSVIMTTTKGSVTVSTIRGVTVLLAAPLPPMTIVPSPLGPVEPDSKEIPCGFSRGNMPSLYRLALSQGNCYMNDTIRLFCPMTKNSRALHHGSALFLGRITHDDNLPVIPVEIESACYTICRLDQSDEAIRIPIEGHTDVLLESENILLSELKTDENWPFDETGYNFRYSLNDSTHTPFPIPGRHYLVTFVLSPRDGSPKIRIEYRVHVI